MVMRTKGYGSAEKHRVGVQSGEVKLVAAYYSLDTGQVELLK